MKDNTQPIKIKDIAEVANVSTGTVDRVLHNRSDVSIKTRKKVLKIIEELGYKTNIIAKTLASKQQINFSVLIPEQEKYSSYWQKPLLGIKDAEKELSTYGVKIKIYFFNISSMKSFKNQYEILLKEKPNAVILAPIFKKESLNFIDKLNLGNIPFILLDSNLDEKNHSIGFVGHDSYQSGIVAAKLIYKRTDDYGNILLINLLSNENNINHLGLRSDGFRSFFKDKNRTGNIVEINMHNLGEKKIHSNFTTIFKDISNIQAIFVTNSKVHIIANFLMKQKFDQEIVLVGYDLIDENIEYLNKDIIDYLISQNPVKQGYSSVMKLFQSTILNEKQDKVNYLPIDIVIKENLMYK